jgi:hypothetical protein
MMINKERVNLELVSEIMLKGSMNYIFEINQAKNEELTSARQKNDEIPNPNHNYEYEIEEKWNEIDSYFINLTMFIKKNFINGKNEEMKLKLLNWGWNEVMTDILSDRDDGFINEEEFQERCGEYARALCEILEMAS